MHQADTPVAASQWRAPDLVDVAHPFGRWAEGTAGLGIVTLPLLIPSGPGNSAPVDVVVFAVVLVTVATAVRAGHLLHVPYALPVLLSVLAALVAELVHGGRTGTVLAVTQDVLLLLWAGSLASIGRHPVVMRRLLVTWAATSTLAAGVLVTAVSLGLNGVAGRVEEEGTRASLTFGDPNRAGSYFAVSVLVLLCAGWPRHRTLRWLAVGLLLLALAQTGSNAGLVAVLTGLLLVAVLAASRRLGTLRGLGAALGAVGLAGFLLSGLDLQALSRQAHESGSPLLANTLGRAQKGGQDRGLLLGETLQVFEREGVTGVGAGGTKEALREEQAQYVKEAHNDYVAALVERGALGALALLLLVGAVAARAVVLLRRGGGTALNSAVPQPMFLAAAAASCAVAGWFHEVSHFRHVWALLGLVAAAGLIARAERSEEEIA
ncbi:MAG: O-antigen ligase protein [Frankiales bacterium]|nr:O-antigen ligase protein [Frankiales bacterium]